MARIMLVSEDDTMRRYIGEKLKSAGHYATRVSEYEVALTLLCETYYDVLLVSVSNEDSEGVAFAHEARRIDPEMRVMFVTGFALVPLIIDEDDPEGLYDRLGDPAHLNKLIPEVTRLLAA
ncbi:MAG: hypothetical protein MRY63_02680 [Neomegalonema sp.]|nr:hypothetical protein [Neomegalonema sp.]